MNQRGDGSTREPVETPREAPVLPRAQVHVVTLDGRLLDEGTSQGGTMSPRPAALLHWSLEKATGPGSPSTHQTRLEHGPWHLWLEWGTLYLPTLVPSRPFCPHGHGHQRQRAIDGCFYFPSGPGDQGHLIQGVEPGKAPHCGLACKYQEKSWTLEISGLSEEVNCSVGRSGVVTGCVVKAQGDFLLQVPHPPHGSRAFSPSPRISGAWSLSGSGDF